MTTRAPGVDAIGAPRHDSVPTSKTENSNSVVKDLEINNSNSVVEDANKNLYPNTPAKQQEGRDTTLSGKSKDETTLVPRSVDGNHLPMQDETSRKRPAYQLEFWVHKKQKSKGEQSDAMAQRHDGDDTYDIEVIGLPKENAKLLHTASLQYNDSTQHEKEAGIEKSVDAKVTSRIVALQDEMQQMVKQTSVQEKIRASRVDSRIEALQYEMQQMVEQSNAHEKIRASGVNSRIEALRDEMQQMIEQSSVHEKIRASGVDSRIEALRDEMQQMVDQSVHERLRASEVNSGIESLRDEMQQMVEQSVHEIIKAESGSKGRKGGKKMK